MNITSEYVGERNSDGLRDGFGKERFSNGDQYEGLFRLNLRNGNGQYWYCNSGALYSGEWKKGCKDGRGKFNYPDGSEYSGEWRHNKRHGFGKYTYQNGDVYEGRYRENIRHGLGTYAFRESNVSYSGTWINDVLKGPIVITYPDFEYHGYFNGNHPVGEGAFTFGMKFMLPGHVEMYQQQSKSESESTAETTEPKCLPRFVAHELMLYDYSALPQQPIPLAESDSSISACTSSSSYENVDLYQLQSPILVSGSPIEDEGDENELCLSQSDEA